jgi:hypothetical protein
MLEQKLNIYPRRRLFTGMEDEIGLRRHLPALVDFG